MRILEVKASHSRPTLPRIEAESIMLIRLYYSYFTFISACTRASLLTFDSTFTIWRCSIENIIQVVSLLPLAWSPR